MAISSINSAFGNFPVDMDPVADPDQAPAADPVFETSNNDIQSLVEQLIPLLQQLLTLLGGGGKAGGSESYVGEAGGGEVGKSASGPLGAQPRTGVPPQAVDPAQLGLGGEWTPQNYDHAIHTPHNEAQSAHFRSDGNTMRFNLRSGNAPFKPGSSTDPRSEYRVNNDYGSGEHLFSADYQVTGSPGNDSTIFQIHRGDGPGRATNMMLRVKDGQLTLYGKPIAEVGDQPFNLKVYHNADNGNIKVFVNNDLVLDTQENLRSSGNYWKFGLYNVDGTAEATVSNVKMFSK